MLYSKCPRGFVTTLARSQPLQAKEPRPDQIGWKLRFNCMVAAASFGTICESAHSVVLASGTLTPDSLFVTEFGRSWLDRLNPVHLPPQMPRDPKVDSLCLHAKHVIDDDQLAVITLPRLMKYRTASAVSDGSSETIPASFTYHKRFNRDVVASLGTTLVHILSDNTKGGAIVFFPSYDYMHSMTSNWNTTPICPSLFHRPCAPPMNRLKPGLTILNALNLVKNRLLLEPKIGSKRNEEGVESYEAVLNQFKESVERTGHCLLFAVYRGKYSEGISMADHYCRMTICLGHPLPNIKDDNLVSKKLFNDALIKGRWTPSALEEAQRDEVGLTRSDLHANPGGDFQWLDGMAYYDMTAWVAINQAAGRVIRHMKDYGVIVLIDSRYESDKHQLNLAQWLRPHVRETGGLGGLSGALSGVFTAARGEELREWVQLHNKRRSTRRSSEYTAE
eukprot:GHVH01012952.1.p1 GENE.GHVH01012952.1~~GHVH01012952.1.p1  ORF type:complete len:448 (+),score=63.88 GHVH01012952.1:994-2337(+)